MNILINWLNIRQKHPSDPLSLPKTEPGACESGWEGGLGGTLPVPSAAAVFGDRSVGRGTLQELEPVSCWEEELCPGHENMWHEGSRKSKNKLLELGTRLE